MTGSVTQLAAQARADRAALVAGVRQLAAFLEQHPELPVTYVQAFTTDKSPDTFLAAAPTVDGDIHLDYYGDVRVERVFHRPDNGRGAVTYAVTAPKDKVCTPRVEDGKVVWDPPASLRRSAA